MLLEHRFSNIRRTRVLFQWRASDRFQTARDPYTIVQNPARRMPQLSMRSRFLIEAVKSVKLEIEVLRLDTPKFGGDSGAGFSLLRDEAAMISVAFGRHWDGNIYATLRSDDGLRIRKEIIECAADRRLRFAHAVIHLELASNRVVARIKLGNTKHRLIGPPLDVDFARVQVDIGSTRPDSVNLILRPTMIAVDGAKSRSSLPGHSNTGFVFRTLALTFAVVVLVLSRLRQHLRR